MTISPKEYKEYQFPKLFMEMENGRFFARK